MGGPRESCSSVQGPWECLRLKMTSVSHRCPSNFCWVIPERLHPQAFYERGLGTRLGLLDVVEGR